MLQQVLEGTWEEMLNHNAELKGKHVKLLIFDEPISMELAPIASLESNAKRPAGRSTAFGKYAGIIPSSEEFLRERRADTAREDRR